MIVTMDKTIEELKKLIELLEGSGVEKIQVDKGVGWIGRGQDLYLGFREAGSRRMLVRFVYSSHRGTGFGAKKGA